jgi:hypothetical protein
MGKLGVGMKVFLLLKFSFAQYRDKTNLDLPIYNADFTAKTDPLYGLFLLLFPIAELEGRLVPLLWLSFLYSQQKSRQPDLSHRIGKV